MTKATAVQRADWALDKAAELVDRARGGVPPSMVYIVAHGLYTVAAQLAALREELVAMRETVDDWPRQWTVNVIHE